MTLDPAYAVKCNTQYNLVAKTAITDANGVHVNAEGCDPATAPNHDCSDVHFFKTVAYGPKPQTSGRALIARSFSSTSAGPGGVNCSATQPCFTVTFNAPYDPATMNLSNCNGSNAANCQVQLVQAGQTTQIPLKCQTAASNAALPTALDSVVCQAMANLAANTSYTVSEAFSGVKIASTIPVLKNDLATPTGTTTPADQTSCTYSGTGTRTFATPCGP
jgi:hypothetical protein